MSFSSPLFRPARRARPSWVAIPAASLILRALVLSIVGLGGAAPVLADGMIYVHHPHPWPPSPPPPHVRPPLPPRPHFPLEVTRHRVSIEVDETLTRTRVEETFHNPNDAQLEGTYLFPLPPDAAVTGFTMKMGGKEVSGEILEKQKAREIYEQIVRQVKDPGLLEYVDRGLFRASVFPIPARGDVEISLEYSENLVRERGAVTYRYPLDTGKYSAGDYRNVVIDMRLRSSSPIRSISCPSHESALISRVSDREARVSFEAKTLRADKDFLCTWNVSEDALAPFVLSYRGVDQEGFFYLTISPRPEKPQVVVPRDVAFVIDTSGSMMGAKMEQVQKALRYCVAGLNAGDRFNIIDFATEARRFRDGLVDVNDETRKAAEVYIGELKARGGTNIEEALRFGLADLQSRDRLGMVVFLTDGEPTIGVIHPAEILRSVKEKNAEKRRIFVFGVGNDLNAKLLDAVARESRGATQYIRPEENVEVPLANFFDKIDSPVLTDLEIAFTSGGVDELVPRPLPDLFRGEQLDIFGRYQTDGQKTVVLKGKFQGEMRAFEYSLSFASNPSNSFVPRLWAMRKIGYLLEQMRLVGETAEVRDEVIRLSKRHGVITPFTSYLIIEEDRIARRDAPMPVGSMPALRGAARDAIASEPAAAAPTEEREAYDLRLREVARAKDAFEGASGAESVGVSRDVGALKAGGAGAPAAIRSYVEKEINAGGPRMQEAEGRTFYLQGTRWVDGALLDPQQGEVSRKVKYLSDEYFQLLTEEPGIGKILALGAEVTFLWKGKVMAIEV